MFTGIIEEVGTVVGVEQLEGASRILVEATTVAADLSHGDSIAVSGVCLTATSWDVRDGSATVTFDVMQETLLRSALGNAAVGAKVNLERAATMQTRLGGHLVQGHVDGTGVVLDRRPSEHWEVVEISLPPDLARYVVEKGSIAVDGVSLTVASVADESFTVSLIPTTLEETTLGRAEAGSVVNLEVDIIAKHVERLMQARDPQS